MSKESIAIISKRLLQGTTRFSTLLSELEEICFEFLDKDDLTYELKESYTEMALQLFCLAERAKRYKV